ncbi:MAG: nuclear transport factor 2 family protein [Gammaproteobacteria bacterium]|nr:nuclear transport factor 2 family protein [Gammaproteobacteria bacterium]MCP5200953.1 nuclear transport factor 2 family protein [Gammaproteobacteria bacterium]
MSIPATLERLITAWNAQDVEAIVATFAEDGAYHEPEGPERLGRSHVGHAAIRAILTHIFTTFPDGRLDPVGPLVVDGEHAYAEWDFAFTSADGQRRVVRGVDLFTFESERIKHKNVFLKRYVR